MTIKERIEAGRRERRVLTRVSRAGWRLEQAERERTWALVSARAERISIRTLAAATELSPSRVHQLVADADLDALDVALGELRAAGWPAPEHPDSGEDTELGSRDSIVGRLSDEVSWLRQCADWLAHLDADSSPPAVNLRPAAGWPDRAVVAADLARVAAVIDRIAADIDELGRARRVQDLDTAAVLPDPRAERRRRLAEPDLEFRAFCARGDCPLYRPRSWSERGTRGRPSDTSAARLTSGPATPATRSGHADDRPVPQRTPGQFRKLDAVAVLTARLLPAPLQREKWWLATYRISPSCAKLAKCGQLGPREGSACRSSQLIPTTDEASDLASCASKCQRLGCIYDFSPPLTPPRESVE